MKTQSESFVTTIAGVELLELAATLVALAAHAAANETQFDSPSPRGGSVVRFKMMLGGRSGWPHIDENSKERYETRKKS